MTIPGIQIISFSHDGKNFYTFNLPNKVYIWRTETGILLDSIILEQTPTKLFFSKDGYTFCYYTYEIDNNSYTDCNIGLYIFDVTKKSKIFYNYFSILKAMNYQHFSGGMVDDNFDLGILDYDLKNNLLTIGSDFLYYIVSYSPIVNNWYSQALKGKFEVMKDTLILMKNLGDEVYSNKYISIGKIYLDMIEFKDKIYISNFEQERTKSNSGGGAHENSIKRFYLSLTSSDSIKLENILYSNYSKGSSWYPYQDPTSWLIGRDVAFSKLFLNDSLNLLMVKYGEIFYYLNTETNKVIDSLIIRKPFMHEEITSKFDYIISIDSNKLLFYNIQSKLLVDSVELPYQINNFTLTTTKNKIIAFNTDGQIFFVQDSLINAIEQKNNNKEIRLTVYPNPSHNSVSLEWDNNQLQANKISVFNTLGQEIYSEKISTLNGGYATFDLTINPKGYYFIVLSGKNAIKSEAFILTEEL